MTPRRAVFVAFVVVMSLITVSATPISAADIGPTTYSFEDGTFQDFSTKALMDFTVEITEDRAQDGTHAVTFYDNDSNSGDAVIYDNRGNYTTFNHTFYTYDNKSNVKHNAIQVWFGSEASEDGWQIEYGNPGGSDTPTLEIKDSSGTVVESKNQDYPQQQWLKINVRVNQSGWVAFTSYYASNGTQIHTIDHELPIIPAGKVGYGFESGSGRVAAYYIDNVTVEGDRSIDTSLMPADGSPLSHPDVLDINGSNSKTDPGHNLSADTTNRTKVADAEDQTIGEAGNWTAAGAPSILHHDGNYYVSLRQRSDNGSRGFKYEIYSVSESEVDNSSAWSLEFGEVMTDDAVSVEGSSIRHYNNKYHLYFAHNPGSNNWESAYVTADTVAGLESQLDDPSTWTNISGLDPGSQKHKDPNVHEFNGNYYLAVDENTGTDINIYKDDNANFTSPSLLGDASGSDNNSNTGVMLYDEDADIWVYWGSGGGGGGQDWFFSTSADLSEWSVQSTQDVPDHGGVVGNWRYMDYADGDDGGGVWVVEADPNQDGVSETYVYDYTTAAAPNTSPPSVDNASATPTGTLTTASPTFEIGVNDSDFPLSHGDEVNASLYVDDKFRGSDTLTSNGTASVQPSALSGGDHTYHWIVNDSYGHSVQSQDFQVSTPANLTIREETSPYNVITSCNANIRFFEDEETDPIIVERSDDDGDGEISFAGLPTGTEFTALIKCDGYHNRTVLIDSLFEQQSAFLLNESRPSVENRFTVEDNTGEFPPESTEIIVQKAINRSEYGGSPSGFSWTNIAGDDIGADQAFVTDLEDGDRYRILVRNDDDETRVLGAYVAETDGTIPLTIGRVSISGDTEAGVGYGATLDDLDGTRVVRLFYTDSQEATTELDIVVYNKSDPNDEIYNETIVNPGQTFTVDSIGVPAGAPDDVTYVVQFNATRSGEPDVNAQVEVGAVGDLFGDLPIDDQAFSLLGWLIWFAATGWFALRSPTAAPAASVLVAAAGTIMGVFYVHPALLGVGGAIGALLLVAGDDP